MEIGGSILSLFNPYNLSGEQRARQQNPQALNVEMTGRETGGNMQPVYTAPSISSVMWSMQSAADTTIKEETQADMDAKARHDQLVGELHEYASMTPAEQIRKRILDELGLDENSLKGMDPDARAAIEKQIQDAIKKELTGIEGGDGDTATADVPQGASESENQGA